MKSCMDESMLHFSTEKLDELTRALFEDADVDHSGTISFEELQAELDKHPGVLENLSIRLVASWWSYSLVHVIAEGLHGYKCVGNLHSNIFARMHFQLLHLHKGLHGYIYMHTSNTLCDCNNWGSEKNSQFAVYCMDYHF